MLYPLFNFLEKAPLDKIVTFLLSFLEENIDPLWSVEHFKWKILENPVGPGILSYATNNGNIVATISISMRRVWRDGQVILAGEIGDGYTHPQFRGGLFSSRDICFHTFSRLGYDEWYPNSSIQTSIFVHLLEKSISVARKLGTQIIYGTPNNNSLSPMIKKLGFNIHPMWLLSMARGAPTWNEFHKVQNCRFRFETANLFPQDIESLWQRARFQYKYCLVRDRDYYQHRFLDNPLAKYLFHMAYFEDQLCGLMISRCHVTVKERIDYCFSDWLYDKEIEGVLPGLISYCYNNAPQNLVTHLTVWSGEKHEDSNIFLNDMGFRTAWKIPILFHNGEEESKVLEISLLDFTIATTDNI